MSSYDDGKVEVCTWIASRFSIASTILDVGACDGAWRNHLRYYPNMDACERFKPNAEYCKHIYRNVFCKDIVDFKYEHYDLAIFGDVIEHMSISDAQKALRYASEHCGTVIVAVPFLYKQGPIYGNPYETHIQDDLTRELFAERYKGFKVLFDCKPLNYCYYYKENDNACET